MRAIYKRELQSYFYTPVGYVFMGVFLCIAGVLFTLSYIRGRSGEILPMLGQFSLMWLLLCPLLTMRAFAGERQRKTDRLLMSAPVSPMGVTAGKFLAACTVLMATALLSLSYILAIALSTRVYPGEVFVGYLGFILQGCAFVALDLAVSSAARSLPTAAFLAFGVNVLLWLLDLLAGGVGSSWARGALRFFSLYVRYEPFLIGQLSLSGVLYYVGFCLLMLFIAARVQDTRRFSGL